MAKVTFQSVTGKTIDIDIVTERVNLADHNFMHPCYDLEVRINGKGAFNGQPRLVDHQKHGVCITTGFGGAPIIPVPAASLDAVKNVFDEYESELERRWRRREELEASVEPHPELRKVMGPGYFD